MYPLRKVPPGIALTKEQLPGHVVLVQDFSEVTVKAFREEFSKVVDSGQTIVPLLIDSYGGDIYSLMAMIEIVLSSLVPVHTIALGKAMSAGAMLFGMGVRRWAGPNSTFMLHEAAGGIWGNVEDLESNSRQVKRMNDKIFHLLAEKTGHTEDRDFFLDLLENSGNTELYITPGQAKKYKLATDLRVPQFKVDVQVKYTLE